MFNFETRYDALKGRMAKVETETITLGDKTRTALRGWPYWAPVVILAAIAGHLV